MLITFIFHSYTITHSYCVLISFPEMIHERFRIVINNFNNYLVAVVFFFCFDARLFFWVSRSRAAGSTAVLPRLLSRPNRLDDVTSIFNP